jgi:hypothetical protein
MSALTPIDTITMDHHAADDHAAELRRTGHRVRVLDRIARAMRDEMRGRADVDPGAGPAMSALTPIEHAFGPVWGACDLLMFYADDHLSCAAEARAAADLFNSGNGAAL